jgi:hypothetical protein
MLFEDAPSYQKRGTLRIDLNPDAIYFFPDTGSSKAKEPELPKLLMLE